METYADIVSRLRALRFGELPAVNAATGVPLGTLAKIHYGTTKDPRGRTLDALRRYFEHAKPVPVETPPRRIRGWAGKQLRSD